MRRETYKNEKKTISMEVDDEPQPPVSSGNEDEEYDPEGEGTTLAYSSRDSCETICGRGINTTGKRQ